MKTNSEVQDRSREMVLRPLCSVVHPRSGHSTAAFTAVEMLVAVFLVVVLGSILVPYLLKVREADRRARCATNMQLIRDALHKYAAENKFEYPRVRYDAANNPNGYTCFTGADEADPFISKSQIAPNDVTASLWLLVRQGMVRDTSVFICPSADSQRDPMTDASGRFVRPTQRGNFRRAANLSYGYSSPFSNAPDYQMNDSRPSDFAILADKGPGFNGTWGHLNGPSHDSPPLDFARLNSLNHARAGQNVLYADDSIRFERSPYCGVGRGAGSEGDNIYTARAERPLNGQAPPANDTGWWGPLIGPSWKFDSYLVPTADEGPR